jgi:glycosyltransferase involved in cell wall biosynthesis
MQKETKKLLKQNPDAVMFGFNLFPQIGIPMRKLKKKFPQCKMVSLLADLPIDDKVDRKGFSKLLRKWFDYSTWESIAACEGFIVLNEYVAKTYLPDKPYVVVDGGLDESGIRPYEFQLSAKKNVLFCGALTEYNGISNLLKAMELLEDKEITLDIYGGGYLEKEVEEFAKTHSNVHYYGKVSNQEVMQKQREAWLLINPRKVDDLIAKVTFPSKTFEYMLSGTPILTTRLNGYGMEYEDKMFFIEEDTPEGIARAILELNQMDDLELSCMAKKAYDFVVEQKTWKKQVEKIEAFL